MAELSEQEMLKKLKEYNTPAITNIVATYPSNSNCLGLYNPWAENWYTDESIHCVFPELGRMIGYVVTCVFSMPDPNYKRLSFMDVIDALDASKKPSILVAKQDFPPEVASKAALFGGNMTSAMKAVGAVGVITDGPSRDLDEIRPMKFQYIMSGTTAGHGDFAVSAVNVPVSVAGMDVAPGELVHMDVHGACKFPSDKLEAVCKNIDDLAKEEETRMSELKEAKTAAEIRSIFTSTEA